MLSQRNGIVNINNIIIANNIQDACLTRQQYQRNSVSPTDASSKAEENKTELYTVGSLACLHFSNKGRARLCLCMLQSFDVP